MRPDRSPKSGSSPFEDRLRTALLDEAREYRPPRDPAWLARGIDARSARRRRRAGPLVLFAAATVAALAVAASAVAPAREPTAAVPSASAASRSADQPITLADCAIFPADAYLAFAGWTTLDVLGASGGDAGPGQPVYALVTDGPAEWVGWRSSGAGPVLPPPVARMGCIYDPTTSRISQIGIPATWHPPGMIDGCPASPGDAFAGYREIGGPHAWLLLPLSGQSWSASIPSYLMLFRLSPPAEPGQTVAVWAAPLGPGQPITGSVGDRPVPSAGTGPEGPSPAASQGPIGGRALSEGSSRYYVVNLRFPAPGCWAVNVTVNGQVMGSAITTIRPRP